VISVINYLLAHVKRSQAVRLVLIGLGCLLVGAILFSLTQHVSLGTSLYWAVTTGTTVGYGDVDPKNAVGRVVAVGVMVTTIPLFAAAFAIFGAAVAAAHVRRLLGMVRKDLAGDEIVILGMHPAVPRIAAGLADAGREVVVVSTADRSEFTDSVRVIAADPTSEAAVRRSHPERAGQLLVTGATDADVLVTAVLVHQLAPDVASLAVAHSGNVSRALHELGMKVTVSAEDLLAETLAKSLEAPHAAELLLQLVGSDGYQLKELPVDPGCIGQRLSRVRVERDGLVLGIVQAGTVLLGVGHDPVLTADDHVLVLEAERAGARSAGVHPD
jgi:voltage-gated potassium channel